MATEIDQEEHSMIVVFPKSWLEEIDTQAKDERRSRRNMVAQLIRDGLDGKTYDPTA